MASFVFFENVWKINRNRINHFYKSKLVFLKKCMMSYFPENFWEISVILTGTSSYVSTDIPEFH